MAAEFSLSNPTLFNVGPVHVTNTMLGGLLTTIICIAIVFIWGYKPKLIPGRIQVLIEMMIGAPYDLLKGAYSNDEKRVRKYLPFYIQRCYNN